MRMKPSELIVRCYAKQEDGVWVALCLELNLATQGDSFADVKRKLEEQIAYYVAEALQDKEYGSQLLTRKAPLSAWLEYYFICLSNHIYHTASVIFNETMPIRFA